MISRERTGAEFLQEYSPRTMSLKFSESFMLSRYPDRIFVYTQCHPLQKERQQMFRLIWQIYTTGIVIFFLVFLLAEEQPFGPALINAIFWPAGVYNTYISVG